MRGRARRGRSPQALRSGTPPPRAAASARRAVPGPIPGMQLQQTEGRDAVARVLGPAQDREQVLDVRQLEELEPAELDVGDVAAAQLDLELAAVVGGAEQHRLLAQLQAGLAVRQHRAHDVVDLPGLVGGHHQMGLLLRAALGEQALGVAFRREAHDRVGGRQDRLGRAVVLLERHDRGRRIEAGREIQDVPDRRGAKAVDRLGIVADHREAATVGLEREQDLRLERVGVLVLVDQDEVEAAADVARDRRRLHHARPVEQEIVVVGDRLGLLGQRRSRRTAALSSACHSWHQGNAF